MASVRDKILKDGVLKHRQSSIGIQRWRPRYVVFKVASSGRLEFTVYKEQPAEAANEVKEIPIEEFAGLEGNLRIDNEKHVFAIITTNATDCFSVESPDEMQDWMRLLKEYLGKELVLNISIPNRQNMLRSGRAQLRVRNTGFTITTCDNPPRCQGSWQMIHIRKFGGSEHFRFQTGSKCPTGACLYTIHTEDNERIKSLFDDLSQHKPIFTDDRVGRRMTLERRIRREDGHSKTMIATPHPKVVNRFSLQPTSNKESPHLYENRQIITDGFKHNTADSVGISPPTGRRHSAIDQQISNPFSHVLAANGSPKSSSIEDLSNGHYRNTYRSGQRSPQKKSSLVEPVPEGYYNVSPPALALKKFRHSSSSPPSASSPEEDSYMNIPGAISRSGRGTPSIGDGDENQEDEYVRFTPVVVSLQGDNLVVRRSSSPEKRSGRTVSPPHQPTLREGVQLYQNMEFMREQQSVFTNGTEEATSGEKRTSTDSSPPTSADSNSPSSQQHPTSDQDWTAHNYTNVEFARVDAQGRSGRMNGAGQRILPYSVPSPDPSPLHQLHSREGRRAFSPSRIHMAPVRKGSAPVLRQVPPKGRYRSGAFSSDSSPSTTPSTLSPTNLGPQSPPIGLKQSHSSFEFQTGTRDALSDHTAPLPDYYNMMVPYLPAHAPRSANSLDHRIPLDFSRVHYSEVQSPKSDATDANRSPKRTSSDRVKGSPPPPPLTTPPVNSDGYAKFTREEKTQVQNLQMDGYASLKDMQQMVVVSDSANIPNGGPNTDASGNTHARLEIRSPSRSPYSSPVGSRSSSPRPGDYDTLAPIEGNETTPSRSPYSHHYDTLLPLLTFPKSSSLSPEPTLYPPNAVYRLAQYNKKVVFLGHGHAYSDIDLNGVGREQTDGERSSSEERQESERPGSASPEGKENRLEWLSPNPTESRAFTFEEEKEKETERPTPKLRRSPNTQSRRRHLPLQDVTIGSSLESEETLEEGMASLVPESVRDATEKAEESVVHSPPPDSRYSPEISTRKGEETNRQSLTGSPKSPRVTPRVKPVPKPRKGRLPSQNSVDSSELLSSGEFNEAKRLSGASTESASSVESERRSQNLQTDAVSSAKSRSPPPTNSRETREFIALKGRIKSIKVETVPEDATNGFVEDEWEVIESPPPKPLKRSRMNRRSDVRERSSPPATVDATPPVPPKQRNRTKYTEVQPQPQPPVIPPRPKDIDIEEEANFTLPLPQATFEFDKPPVPPKPRLLNQPRQEDLEKYAVVAFATLPTRYTRVSCTLQPNQRASSSVVPLSSERVDYMAIDFKMSENLARFKEEVAEERREFMERAKRS